MKKTRDRVKELIRVKASDLRASASNWRLHGDQQKAAMRGILDEVGFVSGLIAFRDKRGKLTLIDGHLRKEISGDELVPVQVVDLTEVEAKKILATFDPIGAMATSNAEALESLLAGVKTDSEGVAAMLAELMAQANAAKPTPLVHEDEVPEPPKVAITKTGDLWQLGAHRLLCGDSTKAEDVERLMGGERARMIATDPPYGVNFVGAKYCPTAKAWDGIKNDHRQGEALRAWLAEMWALWIKHCCQDASFYSWAAAMDEGAAAAAALRDAGIHVQAQIIWVKNALVLGQAGYQWRHENCWYGFIKGKKHRWLGGRSQTTVWEVKKVANSAYEHPMQKPVELYAISIRNHTNEGDVVAEPFSGSGSQIIAAEQLNRRCFAMELDPIYVDVAVARWERLTGKKAKRITAEAKPPRRGRT